ncbi:VanZ family protein [Ectothiorhodospira mobilis]|uniref:VanZ family protein n=1 Tax=Ectothiorhodospira mobilis TaxID=195064 RepID=UPI00190635C9|nr:VanZ family protein [Ectothiorhodospira mobilis]MBK1691360.1 hypothetical protein [Ectothiorhodospira mobilis]
MPRSQTSRWALAAWLSLAAVLYVTLLPFEFEDHGLAEGWRHFTALSPGRMQAADRQQWVANVLMFLPLGFFWSGWLQAGVHGRVAAWAVAFSVIALGTVTTVTVEFLHFWIPERESSLLDMSGNALGALLGVLAWHGLAGRRGGRLLLRLQRGGMEALRAGLALYAGLYLLLALLPLDFMLSWAEVAAKFSGDGWGIWRAGGGVDDLRWVLLRLLEVLLTLPLGALLAMGVGKRWTGMGLLAGAILSGLGLGLLLEWGQFLTVNGVAEGASVLFRAVGVVAGMALFQGRGLLHPERVRPWIRPLLGLAVLPYLFLLVLLTLGGQGFSPEPAVAEKLSDLRLLPGYYHYHVSEAAAISSVFLHLSLYAPLGAGAWLWYWGNGRIPRAGAALAVSWAFGLALLMETGKLVLDGLRPDPAGPFIAAIAAGLAWVICAWLRAGVEGATGSVPAAMAPSRGAALAFPGFVPDATGTIPRFGHRNGDVSRNGPGPERRSSRDGRGMPPGRREAVPGCKSTGDMGPSPWMIPGVLLAVLALALALLWPVAPVWLAMGIVVYGVLLWYRPDLAWLLIPPLVPLLDLSLWTGWRYLDELDLFLLATAAVLCLRWRPVDGARWLPPVLAWAFGALALSTAVSLLLALTPPPPVTVDTWARYTHPYHGLRVVKGLFWALLLFILTRGLVRSPGWLLSHRLLPGMVLSLAMGLVTVLYERWAYPGLLDFESGYRITGNFTDMHVGGPSIETFLVMAMPWALLWVWRRRTAPAVAAAAVLLVVGIYALAVTYSRGGYLGLAVAAGVVLTGMIAAAAASRQRGLLPLMLVVPLLVGGVALPWVAGGHVGERMDRVEADFERRMEHWRLALDLRPPGVMPGLFGSGPGAFPGIYAAGNPAARLPGNFALEDGALLLGGGDSLYMNQRLGHLPAGGYTLTLQARADAGVELGIHVCRKKIRGSFGCHHARLEWPAGASQGEERTWRFEHRPGPREAQGWVLTLAAPAASDPIRVEDVSLVSSDGREWLRNGEFSQGLRHWYFTTDHLWPWRVENQFLEILFDRGWLGLVAFCGVLVAGLGYLARGALGGHFTDAVLLASLTGVLGVGIFGTVFWSPRLALLFYLILLLGVAAARERTLLEAVPMGSRGHDPGRIPPPDAGFVRGVE